MNAGSGRSAGNPSDYGGVGGSVNRSRASTSEITLDGVPDMYGHSSAYVPPQDLVQEYKIETAKYDASLGHAAGAERDRVFYFMDTRNSAVESCGHAMPMNLVNAMTSSRYARCV